jgi:hypothetical protein
MVSIIAPRTTATRVPPSTFGGSVAVAVAAASVGAAVSLAASSVGASVGASVTSAAAVAGAVGDSAAAGVVPPDGVLDANASAGPVGVPEVVPDAQADRTAKESTMVNKKDTAFDSLNLALYILLSFIHQANRLAG